MLNFGKLTNEELISLLEVTRKAVVAGNEEQIEAWNRLFDEATKQLEKRLGKEEKEVN